MDISKEIGLRLRQIADENGGPAAFAKMLNVSPQAINDYLSGRRIPGNKMQSRLRDLHLDTMWIMTGIIADKERQQNEIKREIEDRKILSYLKSKGLDTLDKIQFIYESYEPLLKVAEKMEEYKTIKGKGKNK